MTMNSDHKEKAFENDIVKGFEAQGWLSAANDEGYDRSRALYIPDLIQWIKTAYPEKYSDYARTHSDADKVIVDTVERTLINKGTLWTLRNEIAIIGFGLFKMSESMPDDSRNTVVSKRYKQNILRVVQQVHFRVEKQESIDLVFFINGIPVATAEVKTNFTQDVNEAVDEYRLKRKPKPNNRTSESALLKFQRGAIVHFAISETDIQMTTKLEGETTRFLPFNKGNDGHKGNPPPTPDNPYPVSYFWKDIGQKDAWLGLFQKFAFIEETEFTNEYGNRTTKRSLVFPRYHQWRAVTNMIADAKLRGVGQKYLIEHSAGSGKTKTITWTAFQLSNLRDEDGNAFFDTILIMSDRKVLDTQLGKAVRQFNPVEGLIQPITSKSGPKTKALVKALEEGKRIVVVTIQTFPFAMEEIILNDKLKGKRFAVIFDEAHNSQTGRSSARLNAALGESGQGQTVNETVDDLLEKLQKSRRRPDNVSFFGFTATPKHQTFMLFGRKPNGEAFDLTADGKLSKEDESICPVSFDKYPMRQAIEEGFIRDVLQGYMPYATAYKLSQAEGHEEDHVRVDPDAAKRGLAKWKTLHPTNVTQKTEFIIEHFRKNVSGMLDGAAKAMIVTSSRAAVVRYQKAFLHYLKEHPEYNDIEVVSIGVPLAAFSGEVLGKDAIHMLDAEQAKQAEWVNLISEDEVYTEQNLNPDVSFAQDGALERAFDGSTYRVMIVANKFQTGFDQPKLCAMYVDKVIANPVEIVQTYSRLNRIFPGKDKTYIIDFVNKQENVLAAFKQYDSGAQITEVQDPQVLEALRQSILDVGIFDVNRVTAFCKEYYEPQLQMVANNKVFDGQGHELLTKIFAEPAKKYAELLEHSLEQCRTLEYEHQNAMLVGDEKRANLIDTYLKEASKEYETLRRFKTNLGRFVSAYNYIAQITAINEGRLEAFSAYCALLHKLLQGVKFSDVDLSSVVLAHYAIKPIGKQSNDDEEAESLRPVSGGGGNEPQGKLPEYLRDILEQVSNFAGDIANTQDALNYCYSVADKVSNNVVAVHQARNNPRDVAKKGALNSAVTKAVFELLAQNQELTAMVAKDADKKNELLDIIYSLLKIDKRILPEDVLEYVRS